MEDHLTTGQMSDIAGGAVAFGSLLLIAIGAIVVLWIVASRQRRTQKTPITELMVTTGARDRA